MKEYSAEQLFDLLNQQDECSWIEANKGHDKASSVMETVCSFSNEPALGGGYILLGVAETNASSPPQKISTPLQKISTPLQKISTPLQKISTPPQEISTSPQEISTPPQEISTPPQISEALKIRINALKEREHNPNKIEAIILDICATGFVQATHVAEILKRGEDYVKRKYLGPMIKDKRLVYRHPDMLNHPNQAYKSNKNS